MFLVCDCELTSIEDKNTLAAAWLALLVTNRDLCYITSRIITQGVKTIEEKVLFLL